MCSEWQPIETAPKDGRDILVYGEWAGETSGRFNGKVATTAFWNGGQSDYPGNGWWCVTVSDGYSSWIEASHWMPRPDPPVVDHPRPTTPVVDYEGGESDPQATRISELEAEVERLEAELAGERDVSKRIARAITDAADGAGTRPAKESVKIVTRHWHSILDQADAIRARSTAMNKGGEL